MHVGLLSVVRALDSFIVEGRTQGMVSTNDTCSFLGYRECEGFTSTEARQLQTSIMNNQFSGNEQDADDSSESMDNTYDISCIESQDKIRKSLLTMNDSFLYNKRVSQEMVNEYFEQIKKIQNQMLMKLETDSQGHKEKREYEFACNEGTYQSPQKRKHNVLDY